MPEGIPSNSGHENFLFFREKEMVDIRFSNPSDRIDFFVPAQTAEAYF